MGFIFLLIILAACLMIVFYSDPERRSEESVFTFYVRSWRESGSHAPGPSQRTVAL